ncbi:hypothetical protein BGZ58_007162 [Dissophora ornata]|nr:hypothetical protein BGZ58_007162 [Dissophora ornata]
MLGMQPTSQSNTDTHSTPHDHPTNTTAPDGDIGIALEDIDDQGGPPHQRRPGLHGRAHIWGPNRTIQMILLTTALTGLQFTWSVEMAYGTPFLLQLGLSKSLMSLVWLAGPLSGLVMQPVVGVLSDRCTSKLGRRRPFLLAGIAAVVVSFLCFGWCREIIRGIFGADYPSLERATILMAVGSIYFLDFAINCVQASCRTLVVDSLPSSQQEAAASWASRLMGIGGIFGYFMGNVNIPELIPAFGDTQIKGLCVIACLLLVFTVGLTCVAVTERVMVRPTETSTSSLDEFLLGFKTVFRAIRYLPTRIQHLCNVQFFAWMGWFPFLFYSSTYIAEIYTREMSEKGVSINPDDTADQDQVHGVQDAAVRAGSFCLLIYSIVSLAASILLPLFVSPGEQITSGSSGPFSNSRIMSGAENGLGGMKRSSKWSRMQLPRWLRLPIEGLTLPKMYTLSLGLVSFSLVSTWYVRDLKGSTILFAFCGVAWAVSMWAPFSILGEVISQQMQEEQHQDRVRGTSQIPRGDSVEVVFQKEDEDDDGEIDEIRLSEGSHGRNYQPVKARESLDEAIRAAEPSFKGSRPGIQIAARSDSFRSRTGTPSPSVIEGSSIIPGSVGWTAPLDDEADMTSGDNDESEDDETRLTMQWQDEERGLIQTGDGHPRSSRPQSRSKPRNTKSSSAIARVISRTRSREEERRSSNRAGQGADASSRPSLRSRNSNPSSPEAASAGALLGIHNIYIVLPQFLVSFLSSVVFAALEPNPQGATGDQSEEPPNPETIGVMLRIGGIMAGVAALLSLKLWAQPRTVVVPHHS